MTSQQDLQDAQPKTHVWTIDPAHSSIEFSIKHLMFAKVRGRFGSFDASLHLDAGDPAGSIVQAEIEVASIDTGTADRDAHLRSGDFFAVDEHPKIRFQSKRVEVDGADRARIIGDLTIRGVTREVVLDVLREGEGTDPWGNTRASYVAKGTIDREDYGLRWNQVLETGGVLVGNKVTIELNIQMVRAAAAA